MNKFLVIGLGSMGKRRVRCLQALGVLSEDIIGMDQREDRCEEAKEKYGIRIVSDETEVDFSMIKAIIVSLPPDKHFEGIQVALKYNKPVFVEASVVLEDVVKIRDSNVNNVFIAPSGTFIFHPVVKKIKEIIDSGKYGKVGNFSYHSGQYLPDWHPWESVNDFYVSKRITGGAREIVPYELTWLVHLLGYPKQVKGYFRKTVDVGCDIEDSYVCSMDYGDMLGMLLVDVVGRNALRNLVINFQNAQLQWYCDIDRLEVYDARTGQWETIEIQDMIHEEGYSKNINENMYIDEIDAFLQGIEDPEKYPNTVDQDLQILEILKQIEDSDGGFDRKQV